MQKLIGQNIEFGIHNMEDIPEIFDDYPEDDQFMLSTDFFWKDGTDIILTERISTLIQ